MLCVALVACASPPAHIAVTPDTNKLLTKGGTVQLTVAGQDEYGNDVAIEGAKWTSSDESIVTVDPSGLVTAVGSGKGTVRAALGELTAASTVEVDLFASATTNAPPFLLPGASWTLSFVMLNEKGERYAGDQPTCTSASPEIANVVDGKIVAVAGGVAKITCKVDDNEFDASVAVIAPELSELAQSGGAVAADYKWVRDSIGLAPEIKKVGADNVKLVKFGIHRGKQTFTYEFCGTPVETKMTLKGDNGPVNLVVTGPCGGATFAEDALPWTGAPWMPLLTAFHDRGLALAADESIEVTASAPDTWTMRGGGKTHVVAKGGVVQP